MVLMKISLRIERQFGIESVHGTLREVPATAFNSLPVQGMLCGLKAFFFPTQQGRLVLLGSNYLVIIDLRCIGVGLIDATIKQKSRPKAAFFVTNGSS